MTLPLLRPMLATSASPFSSGDYIYEVKWDGYRCLAYLDRETVLRSRNLIDLTPAFPELANAHRAVRDRPVIIDGEIVVLVDGKASFSAIQKRGRTRNPDRIAIAAQRSPAVLVAFDLLYLNGKSIMPRPVEERRAMLQEILEHDPSLVVSDHVTGDGVPFFEACTKLGMEGVVAKRIGSPYLPGKRSPLWRKIRASRDADLVICGWEPGRGRRRLGSLILGGYDGETLRYQGKVGSGFTESEEETLTKAMKDIEVPTPSLPVAKGYLVDPHWTLPVLVCSVFFTEVTPEGHLRHPSYKGLRFDKRPEDCGLAIRQI